MDLGDFESGLLVLQSEESEKETDLLQVLSALVSCSGHKGYRSWKRCCWKIVDDCSVLQGHIYRFLQKNYRYGEVPMQKCEYLARKPEFLSTCD